MVTFDERKKLTVEDARVFAQALIDQGPTKIEYLFLAGNEFGDEGPIYDESEKEDRSRRMATRFSECVRRSSFDTRSSAARMQSSLRKSLKKLEQLDSD